MSSYNCLYCNKCYNIKYYYERHTLLCAFLHKSKKEKNMIIESGNPLLTDAQTKDLVLRLLYKVEQQDIRIKKIEDRIKKVEDENRILKRKQGIRIEQYLNSEEVPVPTNTLTEWFKLIPLTTTHLETIFKSDLLTAMILCIREALESMDINGIPCCAFIQKKNILYSYDIRERSSPKWEKLSNDDFISILSILSKRFIPMFLKYSNNPSSIYVNKWNENETIYLGKVRGESCETDRANAIKEYLYNTLKRNFMEIEIL